MSLYQLLCGFVQMGLIEFNKQNFNASCVSGIYATIIVNLVYQLNLMDASIVVFVVSAFMYFKK